MARNRVLSVPPTGHRFTRPAPAAAAPHLAPAGLAARIEEAALRIAFSRLLRSVGLTPVTSLVFIGLFSPHFPHAPPAWWFVGIPLTGRAPRAECCEARHRARVTSRASAAAAAPLAGGRR